MTNNIEPINSDIYIFQARLSNLVSMLFTKTYLQYNDDDSVLVGGNKTLIKSSKNGDRISDAGDNIGAFVVNDNIKTQQQIKTSIVGQDNIAEFGILKTKRRKNNINISNLINNENATKIITRLFRLLRFNLLNLDVTENQDVVVSVDNQKIDTFNRKDGLDKRYLKALSIGKPLSKAASIDYENYLDLQKIVKEKFKNLLKEKDPNKAGLFTDGWPLSDTDKNNIIFWFGFEGHAKYLSKKEFDTISMMHTTIVYSADEFSKLSKPHNDYIFISMGLGSNPNNNASDNNNYASTTIAIYTNQIQIGFYVVFNNKIIHKLNGTWTDVSIDVDFSKYKDIEINLSVFDITVYGYKNNGEKELLVNKYNAPYYSLLEPYFQKVLHLASELNDVNYIKFFGGWFKLQPNKIKIKKMTLAVKQPTFCEPLYQTVVKQDKITTMPLIRCIDSKEQGDYNE